MAFAAPESFLGLLPVKVRRVSGGLLLGHNSELCGRESLVVRCSSLGQLPATRLVLGACRFKSWQETVL